MIVKKFFKVMTVIHEYCHVILIKLTPGCEVIEIEWHPVDSNCNAQVVWRSSYTVKAWQKVIICWAPVIPLLIGLLTQSIVLIIIGSLVAAGTGDPSIEDCDYDRITTHSNITVSKVLYSIELLLHVIGAGIIGTSVI